MRRQRVQALPSTRSAGDCEDLATVSVVMNNLALMQQRDNIGITALDEAGNSSNDNMGSRAMLADEVVPLIQTGVVVAAEAPAVEEIMTLTFAEALCVPDAVGPPIVECDLDPLDPANYYLNGSDLDGTATVEVDETGRIVTLTAAGGFGVSDAIYLVLPRSRTCRVIARTSTILIQVRCGSRLTTRLRP